MASAAFYDLPLATLQELQAEYIAAIKAIATNGVSYSIGGRSLSRANLTEVKDTLADITAAINRANGNRRRVVYADFGGVRV